MSTSRGKLSQSSLSKMSSKNVSDSEAEGKDISVVKLPDGYWQELYTNSKNKQLKKILSRVIDRDLELYKEILISYCYQLEAVESVDANKVTVEHWVIGMDDDNTVDVVHHGEAESILSEWIQYCSLPKLLANGKKHNKVTTFDQLIALMSQFNPYWVLEVASYSLAGGDFSRIQPNDEYSYEVSKVQMEQIYDNLSKVYDSLGRKIVKKMVKSSSSE
jgi:hypothetical protein